MDLLSLHNSRWLILKSTRRLTNALNKAATIIPKPRLTRPRLRSGRPNVALPHATSPLPSGSTNTVGQALAQLSSSTSDTAPPKRYDLYWGSFGELPAPSNRWKPRLAGEPSFGLRGRMYTRGQRSPKSGSSDYSFGRIAAPGCCCVFGVRYFSRNPSQLRSRGKQPFPSRIDPYCECFLLRKNSTARS